ncbi:MAG TPA: PQQ-binding-like beta-propeller repeat protein, partial [Planctomycetota bacterium]|nr:PQQ-binding-like beta-propeller repeat protein [Planctomycetota bacterium]
TRIPACDKMGETGLSPQGHLVAIGDRLVVPNGRALPAGLELGTGKLVYFVPGARGGGSRVSAHGNLAFVGRDRAVNLYDFRDVGCRWAYQGAQAPKGYDQDSYGHEVGLCETLYLPSKMVEGCDAASAFADGIAYGLVKGEVRAYDLGKALTVEEKFPFYGRTERALKWEPPLLWRMKTVHEGQSGAGVIKAGKRLYGAAGRKLFALENLGGEPRIAWERDIEGKPTSLIAADKKLFVATAEGGLYCFGEGAAGKSIPADSLLPEAKDGPWADKVRGIVGSTGAKSGYGLVLGLSEGQLVEELLKQTDLQVIAVDADVKKIDALRRRCQARGLLGKRVELFAAKPFEFLFPPYLASLIVSEDPKAGAFSPREHAAKLFGTLRPYGGTLCLDLPQDLRAGWESWARENAPTGGKAKSANGLSILVREGPLPGSAPWTHEFGDVARTLSSEDDLVRAPLGVLWYGDAAGAAQWKATPNRAVVSGGRLFLVEGHAGSAAIRAVDVYTGRLLWHVQEPSPTDGQLRLAALDDRVYAVNDGRCRVLDSETGKTLKIFTFNATGETAARDLRVDGDVIVIGCGEYKKGDVTGDASWQQGYCESSTLIGLDRRSGVELWRR